MPATPDDLFARLDSLGIAHSTVTHPPLFTVEESRKLRGEIPGAHTKNLFLKCKKGTLWLVVALESTAIDMKRLHGLLGCGRLSFGKPELMRDMLGVEPGSVTPFALINDTGNCINVVLEEAMLEEEPLNFHPLQNVATTAISRDGLLAFIASCGHAPRILSLDTGTEQVVKAG
jgi:Ala-tRNA(Pro) deacylase